MKLKGKVVLITGSSRGIGKEFSMGFAKEGADVIVNGRGHYLIWKNRYSGE
jgi:3-oxoacyl-[acyl-carrier protein] reductase